MEPTQTIGQRIKRVRGELSQKAFGVKIGLSQTAVTALENDQSEPRLSTFNKIVEVFRVSPEWLRCGTGNMWEVPDPRISVIADSEVSQGVVHDGPKEEAPHMTAETNPDEYLHKYNALLELVTKGFFGSPEQMLKGLSKKTRASSEAASLFETVDALAQESLAVAYTAPGFKWGIHRQLA